MRTVAGRCRQWRLPGVPMVAGIRPEGGRGVITTAEGFFAAARKILRVESCPVGRAWDAGTPQERKALAMVAGMGAYIPEWLWETMTLEQQFECRRRMESEWRLHDRPWRELTVEQRQGISMAARGAGRWLAGVVSGFSTAGEPANQEG